MPQARASTRSEPVPVRVDGAGPSRATDRGLRLVAVVAEHHPGGIALADAARAVRLSASTALRQLRALESAGFAARDAEGRWTAGAELLRIARSLTASTTLPQLAQPVLESLAATTGESAYLAEPVDRTTAVYVAMAASHHAVRHVSWLGRTLPRRGTAVGAALAGAVDDDGVVLRQDTVEDGVTAVSAPVRDATGAVVAAVSVVGPSYRLGQADLDATRAAVAAAAAELGRRAGHRDG